MHASCEEYVWALVVLDYTVFINLKNLMHASCNEHGRKTQIGTLNPRPSATWLWMVTQSVAACTCKFCFLSLTDDRICLSLFCWVGFFEGIANGFVFGESLTFSPFMFPSTICLGQIPASCLDSIRDRWCTRRSRFQISGSRIIAMGYSRREYYR